MRRPHKEGSTFLATYLRFVVWPADAAPQTFSAQRPPFVVPSLALALVSLVGLPIVFAAGGSPWSGFDDAATVGTLVLGLTVIFFVLIMAGVLTILGVGVDVYRLLASVAYSTAPLAATAPLILLAAPSTGHPPTIGAGVGSLALTALPYLALGGAVLTGRTLHYSLHSAIPATPSDRSVALVLGPVALLGALVWALIVADTVNAVTFARLNQTAAVLFGGGAP